MPSAKCSFASATGQGDRRRRWWCEGRRSFWTNPDEPVGAHGCAPAALGISWISKPYTSAHPAAPVLRHGESCLRWQPPRSEWTSTSTDTFVYQLKNAVQPQDAEGHSTHADKRRPPLPPIRSFAL